MSPDHPARDEWETFFVDLPKISLDAIPQPVIQTERPRIHTRKATPLRRRINKYAAGTTNIDSSGAVIMPPTIAELGRDAG